VRPRVAIVYNEPMPDRYGDVGETKAVFGVLEAVAGVEGSLADHGHRVIRVPLLPPLEAAKERLRRVKADVIFNLFEGFAGDPQTEVALAAFLPELGLPYTGNPAEALAAALDKVRAKAIFESAGIATPVWQELRSDTIGQFRLSFPCIVKPCAEDASHGVGPESVVHDLPSLERQVGRICRYFGGRALVEEYIDGREFNITVLGNSDPTVLAISEIVYTLPPGLPRILTFQAKWDEGTIYCDGTVNVCPAEIPDELRNAIAEVAIRTFNAFGCRGYARVDFRMDHRGGLKVLEVNPNPDISPGVGAARQARASGYTYGEFIERIVKLAMEGRAIDRSPLAAPIAVGKGTEPLIRPMTAEDKPAVMEMLRSIPEFVPQEVVVAGELIDAYLANGVASGYDLRVAVMEGEVVGYVCFGPTPLTQGTWDLYWIAVSPRSQGKGIGRALMNLVEAEVRKAKGRIVLVETASKPGYEKTREFYRSRGYEVISRIPDFYEPGDDKLTFQKRLDCPKRRSSGVSEKSADGG